MHVKCNAGTVKTNMMGDLAGYGPVWWHPDGLANILSMSQVIGKGFEVEFVMRGVERPMFVVYNLMVLVVSLFAQSLDFICAMNLRSKVESLWSVR
jgi:hypothetical protein